MGGRASCITEWIPWAVGGVTNRRRMGGGGGGRDLPEPVGMEKKKV